MVDYRNIKIPDEMRKEVAKIIEGKKELGYRTVSEFVIDAIRRRIEDFKKID